MKYKIHSNGVIGLNIKKIFVYTLCFALIGCSKPENNDISSETVFDKVAKATNFEEEKKMNLSEMKNSQRYGISSDKIKDGFAAYSMEGEKADSLIILRAKKDEDVDSLEENILAYVNDMTSAWDKNENENKKLEKRVFETVDKFVMLYVGDEPDKAKEIFENTVKKA